MSLAASQMPLKLVNIIYRGDDNQSDEANLRHPVN